MPSRHLLSLTLVGVATAAGLGCGEARDRDRAPASTVTVAPTAPRAGRVDPRLLAPRGVPRQPTGPATAPAERVIRAWTLAVRRDQIARAASYFAIPSRFQNDSPVLRLGDRAAVRLLLSGLSCGAVPTQLRAAGRYTIVRFRLVRRAGADCGAGTGHTAVAAILVSGGRIHAWYRLGDLEHRAPEAGGGAAGPDGGPSI